MPFDEKRLRAPSIESRCRQPIWKQIPFKEDNKRKKEISGEKVGYNSKTKTNHQWPIRDKKNYKLGEILKLRLKSKLRLSMINMIIIFYVIISYITANDFFLNWVELSLNSANPRNLKITEVWIGLTLKRSCLSRVCCWCFGSILVSYTRCGYAVGSSPFTVMTNIFVTEFSEFSATFRKNSIITIKGSCLLSVDECTDTFNRHCH